MVVVQAHAMVSPDSPAGILLDGCDHTIRSLNPADIAAKNHTEQPTGADWKAARERVRAKYPRAFAWIGSLWHIENAAVGGVGGIWLGSGPTEAEAWIDAAGRM